MKIKSSVGSQLFDAINILLMLLLAISTIYPIIYVTAVSFSNIGFVSKGEVFLWPKGFTLEAYKVVFNDESVWRSYWNTIRYTFMQVLFTLTFTSLTAYPLSKSRLLWRRPVLLFIGFTLLFHGGLIPTFLLIKKLHMVNTMWALIIPGAVNTMYLFIMRTFFEGLPEELEDAARIDGCNPLQVLWKIVLPLSVPVMVTIGLFTAVTQWNSFFGSLIYLSDKDMFPLQVHLRNVVISGSALFANRGDGNDVVVLETIKYSTLMVATAPILLVYPFIQKYFVKGALIGSIK